MKLEQSAAGRTEVGPVQTITVGPVQTIVPTRSEGKPAAPAGQVPARSHGPTAMPTWHITSTPFIAAEQLLRGESENREVSVLSVALSGGGL